MITILQTRSEELAAFHRDPWPVQQTFSTPLQDLNSFASVIEGGFVWQRADFSTDEVVFDLDDTLRLMEKYHLHLDNPWEFNLRVYGPEKIKEALEAVLGDWIDFLFLPSPESIAIYADHDEYTTFYSKNAGTLAGLTQRLIGAGFRPIEGYVRGRSGNKLR
jgi:hypothetical protein